MKKSIFERMLGLTLAVAVGAATPVTAFAETQTPEISEESEVAETEEEISLESEEAEDFISEDVIEVPSDNSLTITDEDINISAEFIGFGDEVDAFISEHGRDAYVIDAFRYSDEVYYLRVVLKMQPYVTNAVLRYVTYNDDDTRVGAAYFSSYSGIKDSFAIDMGKVPVEWLSSGETLRFYAHWDTKILNGYSLNANGGVFDDAVLFGGKTITYTLGDGESIKPVEGNDNNTTVEITYNKDRTVVKIPVMQNGFMPLPQDGEGISMDLAGRPYDGDRLPLLGWNTKADGSGEQYTGKSVLLEKDTRYSVSDWLNPTVTLYAIFPEYYGAEFILDGVSYVGDYWTDTPDPTHTESLEKLFTMAIEGSEDNFVKEGYTLSWFLDEDYTIPADLSIRIDDCKRLSDRLTAYGKWTEPEQEVKEQFGTVIFKGLDGSDEEIELEVGKDLDLSKYLFTRKGYTFKNWTAEVDGKEKTYLKNDRIEKLFKNEGEEFVITANWSLNTYKIAYNLKGGKQDKAAPATYDVESEVQLYVPVKSNYVFKGWDIKIDGKAVTDADELAAIYDSENNRIRKGTVGNLTLSARFEPFGYKIVFHVKGVEKALTFDDYGEEEPIKYSDAVNFNSAAMEIEEELGWHETTVGENNSNRDLKIVGFSRTEDGKTDYDRIKSYSKLTNTEEELHLYAITEKKTYEIDYHLDEYPGATLTKPIYTFEEGNKKFDLPKAKCPGYKFYGWEFDFSRNSDKTLFYSYVRKCTPYECGAEFALTVAKSVNNDIEVRPYFVPNKIKVYVAPNGSGVYEEKSVTNRYGETDWKTVPVTAKRAYGVVQYRGGLYSDWYNESMTSWFRPGYDFVGYSKNPKATSEDEIFTELDPDNFSDVATSGSGTIYCIWKKSEYEIDFYPAAFIEDGEEIETDILDYDFPDLPERLICGKGVTLPKATLEGYQFLGWKDYNGIYRFNKVAKKGGYITAIRDGNLSDISLYPVFKRCSYNLYINTNGGSYGKQHEFVVAKDIDYDENVSEYLLPYNNLSVKRKGYKLLGFSRDKNGETGIILGADGKPIYKSHSLILHGNKKVTLYAIWKKL